VFVGVIYAAASALGFAVPHFQPSGNNSSSNSQLPGTHFLNSPGLDRNRTASIGLSTFYIYSSFIHLSNFMVITDEFFFTKKEMISLRDSLNMCIEAQTGGFVGKSHNSLRIKRSSMGFAFHI
jgi:hypothetical protein